MRQVFEEMHVLYEANSVDRYILHNTNQNYFVT